MSRYLEQVHHYNLDPVKLPEDFPARLEDFKKACGFSWSEMSRRLEARPKTVLRWRQGTEPKAGHYHQLFLLADSLGLLKILLYGVPPLPVSDTEEALFP